MKLSDPNAPKLSKAEKKEKLKQEMKEKKKEEKKKKLAKKRANFDENTPEGQLEREMQKVSLVQARMAKNKRKPKKIATVREDRGNTG